MQESSVSYILDLDGSSLQKFAGGEIWVCYGGVYLITRAFHAEATLVTRHLCATQILVDKSLTKRRGKFTPQKR